MIQVPGALLARFETCLAARRQIGVRLDKWAFWNWEIMGAPYSLANINRHRKRGQVLKSHFFWSRDRGQKVHAGWACF
jgi:hypothetical protein